MTPAAETLIIENLDLVRKVAARLAKKMPASIQMDELVSAGNVGLCEAAIRFDPELHASFTVWAMIRIRGAIIDTYRGRNYPRLNEQLPEEWLGSTSDIALPDALVDSSPSAETVLIERETSVVISIEAGRAKRELLTETEGRVLDHHVNGLSMREIGKREGRSGAWSHYTLHSAKRKMRAELVDIGDHRTAA